MQHIFFCCYRFSKKNKPDILKLIWRCNNGPLIEYACKLKNQLFVALE